MANANRTIANARRVNNSDFMVFGSGKGVDAFEKAARDAGYTNVKVSSFRVGSNDRRDYNFRVTVYWKDGQNAPDMDAFFKATEIV
jgi:hypothetical protein